MKKFFYIISFLIIFLINIYNLSWKNKTHILGSYELESNPNVQLYFTWDEYKYWAVNIITNESTNERTGQAISEGSYSLEESKNFFQANTFKFNDRLGDFEYFSIKNRHLDIIVVIDGEDHMFL